MARQALSREESSFRKRSKMARMQSPAEGGVILSKDDASSGDLGDPFLHDFTGFEIGYPLGRDLHGNFWVVGVSPDSGFSFDWLKNAEVSQFDCSSGGEAVYDGIENSLNDLFGLELS